MVALPREYHSRTTAPSVDRPPLRQQLAVCVLPTVRAAVRAVGAQHIAVSAGRLHGAADDCACSGTGSGSTEGDGGADQSGAKHRPDGCTDPAGARRDHKPKLRAAVSYVAGHKGVLLVYDGSRDDRVRATDPVADERLDRTAADCRGEREE